MKFSLKAEPIWLFILLILILPGLFLLLKKDLYPSHDGLYHIGRIKEFHMALMERQVPPRLAPQLLDGAAYPLFVVNYQLPYYFAEFFQLATNNAVVAYKAVLAISFILSGVFAFMLFKKNGSNIASLTGAAVFTYLPYRFANLYTRGSFGESVSFMFIPLSLFALHLIKEKKEMGFFY